MVRQRAVATWVAPPAILPQQFLPRVRPATWNTAPMSAPQQLMEQYRAAFMRADVRALVDCFTFPLQVVTVTDGEASPSVADGEEWPGVIDSLLGAYKRLGVTDCVPLATEIIEPIDAVAVVRVNWALLREDSEPVYDFTAVYTLAQVAGRLRIVALAHDELPKMRAALQAP